MREIGFNGVPSRIGGGYRRRDRIDYGVCQIREFQIEAKMRNGTGSVSITVFLCFFLGFHFELYE